MSLPVRIGVISDTHGRFPDWVVDYFEGVTAIIHAGDIGNMEVVESLEEIAPVYAVHGNMDYGQVRASFPRTDLFKIADCYFYLVHEPHLLDIDPQAAGVRCVVFGHTHLPHVADRDSVLFLNPGSACLPRAGRPTVAILSVEQGKPVADIVSPELSGFSN